MDDVCEYCGTIIDSVEKVIACQQCLETPYCSKSCRSKDRRCHRGNWGCKNPTTFDWSVIARFFNLLSKDSFIYKYKEEPIMIFPGPITCQYEGEIIPKALRHDKTAQDALDFLFADSQTPKALIGTQYYVFKHRDLPRIFFRQLSERQRDEMLGIIVSDNKKKTVIMSSSSSSSDSSSSNNNKN